MRRAIQRGWFEGSILLPGRSRLGDDLGNEERIEALTWYGQGLGLELPSKTGVAESIVRSALLCLRSPGRIGFSELVAPTNASPVTAKWAIGDLRFVVPSGWRERSVVPMRHQSTPACSVARTVLPKPRARTPRATPTRRSVQWPQAGLARSHEDSVRMLPPIK